MKPLKLKISNFLSIGEAELSFSDGETLIVGANNDNPSSDSNGSGKSSIWDALVWCLYGKTIRDIPVNEVGNYKSKSETSVSFYFETEGEAVWKWKITRTRKEDHSNLSLKEFKLEKWTEVGEATATRTQKQIDGLLGLDYSCFVGSCFFGQDVLRFASLSDKGKKEILEKLLGIEEYERAHRLARSKVSSLKLSSGLVDASQTNAQKQVEDLEKRSVELLEQKEKSKGSSEDALKKLRANREVVKSELEEVTSKIEENEKELLSLSSIKEKMLEREKKTARYRQAYETVALEISEDQAEIWRVRDSEKKECERCHQEMDREVSKNLILEISNRVDESAKRLPLLASKYRKMKKRLKASRVELAGTGEEEITSELFKLRASVSKLSSSLETIKYQIKHLKEAPSAEEAVYQEVQRNLEKAKVLLESSRVEGKAVGRKFRMMKYWEKAFSQHGIRSYLIESLIPFLNDRVKYYSGIMTDGTITISFSPIKERKTGEEVDSFHVEVINRDGAKVYGGNSAGERQRIDLCIALALKDLAATRSKQAAGLMVFDEVFERLDESGCQKVVELLKTEGGRWGSVYIITHNDSLKQYFSKTIKVIKRNGISRIG